MESAVASEQPPGNLTELVPRRHRRHVMRVSVAGAASAAVVAVLIPAGIRVLGHPGPGPAGRQWPTASTVYAEFEAKLTATIVPISTATNKPGRRIHVAGYLTRAAIVATPASNLTRGRRKRHLSRR